VRILVTGHAGFIGQHLCRELEGAGHTVVGHDRGQGDLTQPGVFDAAVVRHQPDRVVHLAAQVGREFGEADVRHTIQSNVTMTAVIARSCGSRGIPVLYASTSEVYGDQGDRVCTEDGPLVRSHNLYGMTKLMGEETLRLYAPDGLRVVRLSMPYGPGAPPGRGRRAMDNFLWWAHHRMPITVHRGAERSWCWVGDTVHGIRLVLERGEHEVYNVGRDDHPVSMHNLAVKSCAMTGAPESLIETVEPPARLTVVKRLSTSRLRQLGWRPAVELDDGMLQVLEWVQRFPPPVAQAA
jgi:nucleoside-diphosphate-sugar epimerase